MKKVAAILVTYDRVDLLKKCLSQLLIQPAALTQILVIDNHSSDDTQSFMSKLVKEHHQVIYSRLDSNLGGAGGFSEGIKQAMSLDVDYFWIMDDDTIPNPDTLTNLLDADKQLQSKWSFLSSNVRWVDNKAARMNQLTTQKYWSDEIGNGLIAVKTGTFVSILIKKNDVERVGLPISEFFIWSDDTEYTIRLSDKFTGYFVINSTVTHETKVNLSVDLVHERDKNKISRYYYSLRNGFYIARREKKVGRYFVRAVLLSLSVIVSNSEYKWLKLKALYRGLFAGFVFNPKIKFYS
ncbi:glycosyltransferase family 2 protein [Lactiplantibacillus pentosus]|uniref:glycosyltransferase family 2 protein n=1 Tax=Lactiplantibacillus pentosus TaxID=1589 RepID=UPI003D2F2F2A